MTTLAIIGGAVLGLIVFSVALDVWDASGGVDGMRRREADRARRRELVRRHGPKR